MPLSYLRRPLFLALVALMLVLALLKARGRLVASPPPELLRYRSYPAVVTEGLAASPLRQDHQGYKVFVEARSLQGRPFPWKVLVHFPKELS